MNYIFRTIVITVIIISFSSCATTPKIAWKPEVKQSIKKIAIVEIPEPSRYLMNPGQAPANAAFYLFGAVGGAIAGSIEAKRYENATNKFTETVMTIKPELAKIMLGKLENGLLQKGYIIHRVPPPPKNKDGKRYDITKIEGNFDAILLADITGGYNAADEKVVPEVNVSISIYSRTGADILFADTYLYGTKKLGRDVLINPDPKYVFKSIDDLYQDITIAVEGMRIGSEKVSERAVDDL